MKKFISFLMTLVMVLTLIVPVFAEEAGSSTEVGMPSVSNPNGLGGIQNFGMQVLGFIQWLGYAVAIAMLIYVGIKYVMASANEKADLKAGLVKYILGAILIGGAAAVCTIIINFSKNQIQVKVSE